MATMSSTVYCQEYSDRSLFVKSETNHPNMSRPVPRLTLEIDSCSELYTDMKESFHNFVHSEVSIGQRICTESLQMWYEGV